MIVNGLDGLDAKSKSSPSGSPSRTGPAAMAPPPGYRPVVSRGGGNLRRGRDTAAGGLRAWVKHVCRPRLQEDRRGPLPPCWEQHPFCLYTLDWLSELWSALYLAPQRDTRILTTPGRVADPAAASRRGADGLRSSRLQPQHH